MAVSPYCILCKIHANACQSPDAHRAGRSIVWKIYVKPGGRDGRQIRETRLTKALAEAREREILVSFQKGELFVNEKPKRTFGEACTHYVEQYLKPNKQFNELYSVAWFQKEIGQAIKLDKIDRNLCIKVYNALKEKGSIASAVRRWCTLYGIFRENSAYLEGNPAKNIIPKRDRKMGQRNKTVYFTNEQYQALIKSIGRGDEIDIIVIFRHTGMRLGDGKALMFEHCDFNMRTIHLVDAKNGEQSSVPMVPEVYDRLRLIQARTGRTTGPVFDMAGIGKRFRERVKAAGLYKPKPDNLTLHSLRHSYGTYLQSTYKDLGITKELMRHKTVAMTLRYAHASDGAKRAAALAASVSEQSDKVEKGVSPHEQKTT